MISRRRSCWLAVRPGGWGRRGPLVGRPPVRLVVNCCWVEWLLQLLRSSPKSWWSVGSRCQPTCGTASWVFGSWPTASPGPAHWQQSGMAWPISVSNEQRQASPCRWRCCWLPVICRCCGRPWYRRCSTGCRLLQIASPGPSPRSLVSRSISFRFVGPSCLVLWKRFWPAAAATCGALWPHLQGKTLITSC